MVKCSDDSLYTWITTDVERRIEEHNSSPKGAKYTRVRRPVELVYTLEVSDKSEASKEEYRIKKLSREEKMKLVK
jgi:putative endonuclease